MENNNFNASRGDKLIDTLLNSPEFFAKKAFGNDLLKEYFDGYPLDTLNTLLTYDNDIVKKEAIYILSELGEEICNYFLDTIIPLLQNTDKTIQYYTMQSIFLGSFVSRYEDFLYVVKMLKNTSDSIRNYALELINKANIEQLKSSLLLMSESIK
jgi:hypothetical protein